jgi:hypothetical protein
VSSLLGVLNTDVDPNIPLKAALAWTDAPAPTGIGGLENQLYLQLVDPDGAVVDGDVTPFPTARNNVQQVVIANPRAGDHRIRVRGVSVIRQAPGAGPGRTRARIRARRVQRLRPQLTWLFRLEEVLSAEVAERRSGGNGLWRSVAIAAVVGSGGGAH